jgi:hypothetical protein
MPVVHPICCGIDVYQAQLTAYLRRVDADRQVTQEVREFATTDDAVLTLSTWLTEQQCPVSALESTGVYWRPVYHVLVGTVEVRGATRRRYGGALGIRPTQRMRAGWWSAWRMASSVRVVSRRLPPRPCVSAS